ncbi:MAG: response regulator [Polyangiales bacterium]
MRAHAEAVEQAATERRADLGDAVRGLPAPPARTAEAAGDDPQASRTPPSTPAFRILVVDDTESLRKMNRIALERMGGHHVDEASGLREALEAVERLAYDVVLLDAMMPDGSGMELSTELRRRHPRMRLVILSAASEAQLAPGGHDADAWWQKPLSPKLLVERIAELLEP